jgi:hypothetical protein
MRYFISLFISATLVFVLGYLNVGAHIENFFTALVVAFVLSLLNGIVRPILEFIAFPITFMTFGFFLFIINTVIVLLASKLVGGFVVHGFWGGLMFSTCLSLAQALALAPLGKVRN